MKSIAYKKIWHVAGVAISILFCVPLFSQTTMDKMWNDRSSGKDLPNVQWFKDAKFGLFIHWGLYSQLGGEWNGKKYYGSGEWLMCQAHIPVDTYADIAKSFNPTRFNAEEWAQIAKDAGVKYMVVTSKHHEGFAMYQSKINKFNIVDATPYKKDPMKALSTAVRNKGIQFGFYYSQFLDWHEPNGGGNDWCFDESKKDYQAYYKEKAIPQLNEIMTNYGPLGIVWFDMPGGMTKEQTQQFVDSLKKLQKNCLFSSRVGRDLGDYTDFGDSEMPATPIDGAWESIYTHNDSWGYIKHDMNFKTPETIIRLLSEAASKGGNLMLNVGPDGTGQIPEQSVKVLREVGKWLKINGESIYATTAGWIPQQQWGVSTSKPGREYLHVWNRPLNGKLLIPDIHNIQIKKMYALADKKEIKWQRSEEGIVIDLPATDPYAINTVYVITYSGTPPEYNSNEPVTISAQYNDNYINASSAKTAGNARVERLTYSHYFGDWKHTTCITGLVSENADKASFDINVAETGDYQIILEYACSKDNSGQEGMVKIGDDKFLFQTLCTTGSNPLNFMAHAIGITTLKKGVNNITVMPLGGKKELFKLKAIVVKPVR